MATKITTHIITERIIRMMDRKGFIDLFWEEWSTGRYQKHEDVYNSLENEYLTIMGRRRYASFKSFRKRRDE
jgi:hypothetical protein